MARPFVCTHDIASDTRGAAIVEFTLLLPLLLYILLGILSYGQYFLIAHSLQQIANDAARATVAGLNPDERRTIATGTVGRETGALPSMGGAVSVSVTETADTVTVRLSMDSRDAALFRTAIVPMPDAVIRRTAVVRTGGFV